MERDRSFGAKAHHPPAIVDWVSKFKSEGTNFIPPGAKLAVRVGGACYRDTCHSVAEFIEAPGK